MVDESTAEVKVEQPCKVLFTAVRNEAPFLVEWIAYHKAIGFDRIVIASNPSVDGTDELLRALAEVGEIEHFSHVPPDGVAPQSNAAKLFDAGGYVATGDWVIWLDADEFLVVNVGYGKLDSLISRIPGKKGAVISWRMFGDSGHTRFPGRFVSPDFSKATRRTAFENRIVKTLMQVGPHFAGFAESNVHRPVLRPGLKLGDVVTGTGAALVDHPKNHAWLNGKQPGELRRCEPNEHGYQLAQINHYAVRTREHFLLKQQRGRGAVANQQGDSNKRHQAHFFHRYNRNDVADRAILRHAELTTKGIERLRGFPRVARAEAEALQRVERAIQTLDLAQLPARKSVALKTSFSGFRLTFPADTAAMVREHYATAQVILEYGSGGSTFLALESGADFVMSVESDSAWSKNIHTRLAENFDDDRFRVHHVDIGKTGDWGTPVDSGGFARYHQYAMNVYSMPWFRQPDLILIDGRFRVACFLAAILFCQKQVTVLFDDYMNRKNYHWVEDLFPRADTAGRMARFDIMPRDIPKAYLERMVGAFVDVR